MEDESSPAPAISPTAAERWRTASRLIRTARRFCYAVESAKRLEEAERLRKTREKVRIAGLVSAAALRFMQGANRKESEEARRAGFGIGPGKASSVVSSRNSLDKLTDPDFEDFARRLHTSSDEGITTYTQPTPSARRKIFGSNVYNNNLSQNFYTFLRRAMSDTTVLILLIYSIASMGLQTALKGWPEGLNGAVAIILGAFLVVTIVAYCDYKQNSISHDFIEQKRKVVVVRDGKKEYLPTHDIVVGDVVMLSPGEQVPADGICIPGQNLLVDESSVNGESTEPTTVNQDSFRLLAGTKVLDGSGKMLVMSVGMRNCMGKLMRILGPKGEKQTPVLKEINGISVIMVAISLFFSVLAMLMKKSGFITVEALPREALPSTLLQYVASALSVFVVGVPVGMSLAVKLYLHFAGFLLKKKGALVKHLSSCETMASVSNICSDKTGTLTTSHMVVNKFLFCGEVISSQAAVELLGSAVYQGFSEILLQSIFLNTGSEVVEHSNGKLTSFGRPTELALLKFGLSTKAQCASRYQHFKKVDDMPFNSHDKIRSVLVTCPDGRNRAFCTGAADIVLHSCTHVVTSDGQSLPLSEESRKVVLDTINGFCHEALRTLCLTFKDLDPSVEGIPSDGYTLIAVVGLTDQLRPEVKDVVQMCSDAGIIVRMVTGDCINTAKAIAKECGILKDDGLAIECQALHAFGQEELKQQITKYKVIARCSPEDKRTVVTYFKNASSGVAAVGDGISDSPFLHEADIGFSMGVAGAEAAKEGADVVILDDDLTAIVHLAKWGRAVYTNILGFVHFQLTLNAVAIAVNFVSTCYLGCALLTPAQILWVNLILDTSYALNLATEPAEELMNQPPVTRGERLITKTMAKNIIGQALYQSAILIVFMFCRRNLLGVEGPGATDILHTFVQYTFVFCQVFNMMNDQVVEKINLFNIRSSRTAIMISKVGYPGIVAVVFLATTSGCCTVPLSWQHWLLSIFVGSMTIVISFLLKFIPLEKEAPPAADHDCYQPLASSPTD